MQETETQTTSTQNGEGVVERRTTTSRSSASGIVLAQRVIWFITGLICVIIATRFVFLLLGANPGAAFTDFVYALSAPFVAPFVGIFGEPTYGRSILEISSLVAIAVYVLIAWGITKLLTIKRPRDEI